MGEMGGPLDRAFIVSVGDSENVCNALMGMVGGHWPPLAKANAKLAT